MHLVVHQVGQLENVDDTDHDFLVERFTGTAVIQSCLAFHVDQFERVTVVAFFELLHDKFFVLDFFAIDHAALVEY